jgi:hypothetical protein
MSGGPIEPIDPELAALLDIEREDAAPREALDRVWTRVAGIVPPAGSAGSPGSGGGAAGGGGATTGGWLASHAAGVAAVTFVVGAATGAGMVSVMRPSVVERVVYVDRPSRPAFPVDVPAPASATSASPPASPAEDTPPSPRPAAPAAASSLSLERGVLADARAALASGDAARALRLSDEHLRRFPRAQLGEEREAIAIQALVGLGRYDEARARAARFRAASPHSLLLPAIDAALASIP